MQTKTKKYAALFAALVTAISLTAAPALAEDVGISNQTSSSEGQSADPSQSTTLAASQGMVPSLSQAPAVDTSQHDVAEEPQNFGAELVDNDADTTQDIDTVIDTADADTTQDIGTVIDTADADTTQDSDTADAGTTQDSDTADAGTNVDIDTTDDLSNKDTQDDKDTQGDANSIADTNNVPSVNSASNTEDFASSPSTQSTDGSQPTNNQAADELALDDQANASASTTKIKSAQALVMAINANSNEGWVKSGSNYRFMVSGTPLSGWLLTPVAPGSKRLASQERYWLDATGIMASDRLVSEEEAGWWAYAKPEGAIATTLYKTGNKVYLPDSNGKLAASGWLLSDAYSKGTKKRYYVESSTHSAVLGFSKSGYAHYTLDDGSVLVKGAHKVGNQVYLADENGRLASPGWIVSDKYGQGTQGYYIEKDYSAHVGFSTNGFAHYTLDEGYVARSPYRVGNLVYLADSDGRIETTAGWHITSKFGQGYQRYWVESGKNAAQIGFFSVDGKQYYTREEGYVLRGALQMSPGVLLADNDGVLATGTGWLISKAYTPQLQRYYLISSGGHSYAKLGLFTVANKLYYGIDKVGYELRNATQTIDGVEYYADNDGVLTPTKPIVTASDKQSVIEAYIKWALDIAEDNSHGYSQYTRWGPDYDCSSLVISALEEAGLDTGSATYTGNMRSQLTKHGFVWISSTSNLLRGDILLNETYHTAIYLGNSKMVEATMSETRGIDGKTGDQTGTEITVNPYRNANWDGVLRYSG